MSAPNYVSTRGGAAVPFREALLGGLAPNGGLYVPTHVPPLGASWETGDSLADLGADVLASWLGGAVDALPALVADALSFPAPLVPLDGAWAGVSVLELFHGPTLSFKDVGARTMARLIGRVLDGEDVTVLVATSGDTGSAVADGFAGVPGVRVVLLYPKDGVSAVQERQLVAARDGVQALAVEGTFDDCQWLVKTAFSARRPGDRRLSSANSINVGRLLPQMLYYVWAVCQGGAAVFCVPSGNLGNLTAGLLAQRSGLPAPPGSAPSFIAAHNANDGFPRFLGGAETRAGASVRTLSNAMDVGVPSNLERLRALFSDDDLRRRVWGTSVADDVTVDTMRAVWEETGYLADPHTAVGLEAVRRYRETTGSDAPVVVLATAHPAKFPDAVRQAVGTAPPEPERLAALRDAPTRVATVPPTLDALRPYLDGETDA